MLCQVATSLSLLVNTPGHLTRGLSPILRIIMVSLCYHPFAYIKYDTFLDIRLGKLEYSQMRLGMAFVEVEKCVTDLEEEDDVEQDVLVLQERVAQQGRTIRSLKNQMDRALGLIQELRSV